MIIRTAWRVDMSQSKQNEAEHSILIVDDDAAFLDGARCGLQRWYVYTGGHGFQSTYFVNFKAFFG